VTTSNPDAPKCVLSLRALVVWSPAKTRLDAELRKTNLKRLEASLKYLAGKLNRRPYTKRETVQKRLVSLRNHHPARRLLTVSLQGEDGQLSLSFERDESAISEAAEIDGRSLLVTNDETLDPNEMLRLSKRRDVPEKRFATVKGPLEVRPVYVHKQERILGLVFCSLVALLAYALLELESARTVGQRTASTVFAEFTSLAVVVTRFTDGSTLRRLSGVTPNHLAPLEALDFPPIEQYAILSC